MTKTSWVYLILTASIMLSAFTVVAPKLAQDLKQEEIPVAEVIYVNLEMFNPETNDWVVADWVHYKVTDEAVPVVVPNEAGLYRIETSSRMSNGRRSASTLGAPFIIK